VAQAVERQRNKGKVLSSNLRTGKKKKTQNKTQKAIDFENSVLLVSREELQL
jgi:hypothetical protein